MENIIFLTLATITVILSILVIAQKNVLYSALFLILTFISLSLIYVLLSAPFVAVIQLIVYVGAVMVLFLFVIMMINIEKDKEHDKIIFQKYIAVLLGIIFFLQIVGIFKNYLFEIKTLTQLDIPNVIKYGRILYREYLIPFELISFLLLISIIGVVVLGKKK